MSGADRRRDARGLKDHSVITLTVDYVFEHGGPACSQVMTMSQGSYRSVAVHIAAGTKRGNRVVVQVQGRGQVGERWGNSGDYRRVSLERFTRTDVRVPSFQPVRLPAFTPRSISVHLDDDSVGIDREYRPVTGGNRRRPRTISFRTFRGGLRRAESGGIDRTAQCRNRQENRLVCGNGASIMKRASDERNEIVIAPAILGERQVARVGRSDGRGTAQVEASEHFGRRASGHTTGFFRIKPCGAPLPWPVEAHRRFRAQVSRRGGRACGSRRRHAGNGFRDYWG